MLIDTHAHFDDERFDEDRHELIMSAKENGIDYIINASCNRETIEASLQLTRDYDFIYCTIGYHPQDADKFDKEAELLVRESLLKPKVLAVGEIGLDYHYDEPDRELQKKAFEKQIFIAEEFGLPIVVHDRDAHEDCLNIIKSCHADKGVFHCYSGSVEMARELLNLGFYISFAGTLTFKNARKLVDVARYVPEDRMLIETDCPYLAPEPFRGKRNYSAYVRYTAQKLAEIRDTSLERVADKTLENAKNLFGF